MSYEDWSAETIRLSQQPDRAELAGSLAPRPCGLDPPLPKASRAAQKAAQIFTEYLRACRDERFALSLLPPGRFLMPGELADSPALTFAPLDRLEGEAPHGLAAGDDAAALRSPTRTRSCGRSIAITSRAWTARSCWSTY